MRALNVSVVSPPKRMRYSSCEYSMRSQNHAVSRRNQVLTDQVVAHSVSHVVKSLMIAPTVIASVDLRRAVLTMAADQERPTRPLEVAKTFLKNAQLLS